jgi:hypothetical protein
MVHRRDGQALSEVSVGDDYEMADFLSKNQSESEAGFVLNNSAFGYHYDQFMIEIWPTQ